jgi:hypothetical protein
LIYAYKTHLIRCNIPTAIRAFLKKERKDH